jgi:hypothetical protein
VVAKDLTEDGWGGYETLVYAENLSEKEVAVEIASLSVDGTPVEDANARFAEVPAGKRALAAPYIENLVEGSKVEVSFRVIEIDPVTREELGELATTDVVTLAMRIITEAQAKNSSKAKRSV